MDRTDMPHWPDRGSGPAKAIAICIVIEALLLGMGMEARALLHDWNSRCEAAADPNINAQIGG